MRADARVGRVHAVDVGVDLADVGADSPGHRDGSGVGAAAPERGDVAVFVDALEARDHGDVAAFERVFDALAVDADDLRLVVRVVGDDARLTAGEAHGLVAARFDGHGQQAHADLLAGRQQTVHLARGRVLVDGRGQAEQLVGRLAHGRDDGDDLVAFLLAAHEPFRDIANPFRRRHARAAELAYDKCHILLSFAVLRAISHFTKCGRLCLTGGATRAIRSSA